MTVTKLFLSLHVLAAVLAVGPVAVAASLFPGSLRRMNDEPDGHDAVTTLRVLHRICRVYAGLGVAVPVFGFATASSLGVLGDPWLITSVVLTAAATAVLALLILPAQDAALAGARAAAPAPVSGSLPESVLGPDSASGLDAVPGPESATGPDPAPRVAARLAMLTGVFNLLWAVVTVLMVVRPGSTTGA